MKSIQAKQDRFWNGRIISIVRESKKQTQFGAISSCPTCQKMQNESKKLALPYHRCSRTEWAEAIRGCLDLQRRIGWKSAAPGERLARDVWRSTLYQSAHKMRYFWIIWFRLHWWNAIRFTHLTRKKLVERDTFDVCDSDYIDETRYFWRIWLWLYH